MRRALGRQLAARRKAAGYVQRELGVAAGYSRTAIANAETGATRTGRQLWERLDRVLGSGELFARGYDRIQAQIAAESRARAARQLPALEAQLAVLGPGGLGPGGLESQAVSQAKLAYRERGWPAEEGPGGRLWLETGTGVDVLEVPRLAGLVAMGWWLFSRGVPDEIRGLPALPDPTEALAVIEAGPVCYFLTRTGACPWTGYPRFRPPPGKPYVSSGQPDDLVAQMEQIEQVRKPPGQAPGTGAAPDDQTPDPP